MLLGTERRVGRAGEQLAVTDTGGPGVPVTLLHGGTRCLADWGPVVARLPLDAVRVVCIDQRSHGASDDTGSWSLDDAVSDLGRVIEELELDRPVVVGHSLGGMVSACYAATAGDGVRGIINLDGHGAGHPSQFPGLEPERVDELLQQAFEDSLAALGAAPALTPAEVDARVESAVREAAAAGLAAGDAEPLLRRAFRHCTDGTFRTSPSGTVNLAMLRSISRLDLRPVYRALACPAVVTLSRPAAADARDSPFRELLLAYDRALPAQLDLIASARSEFRVQRWPDLGHMVHLEAPERVARLIAGVATGASSRG